MKKLPKECNILQIEEKWQRKWEEMGVYRFDWKDRTRPIYSVDTPPPYPSGNFHINRRRIWYKENRNAPRGIHQTLQKIRQ